MHVKNLFVKFPGLYLLSGFCAILILSSCSDSGEKNTSTMTPQSPSPMEEHVRAHERITDTLFSGNKMILEDILPKPVTIYTPKAAENESNVDLLFHFHGSPNVPIQAIDQIGKPVILVVINLGSGSSTYQRPFLDPAVFEELVAKTLSKEGVGNINSIYCSSFSAGYGAIRELLKTHFEKIDGVLLLDGLHTDYIPDGMPLASGGRLNTEKLDVFLSYAKMAMEGKKKMLITHSEIFPGTYASTTETAEYILNACGLKRHPVLAWGPGGMQEIANTESGQLQVRTFAGNTAPDHIDHFHGIGEFLMPFWKN